MGHIAIPIPSHPDNQEIEVEVTINGQREALHYRVESFYWNQWETATRSRADCLHDILSSYDREWALYYINSPTERYVRITFIKKKETLLLSPFLYSLLNL